MTILGKIMTIFVFILSLVWFWLTVNLYATRAEWKKAYETARKEAERNAKDTDDLKEQLRRERASIEGRQQAADQAVKAIALQRDQVQKNYDELLATSNKVADATAQLTPAIKEYDASTKKLQDQVDLLSTANSTLSKDRDAAVTAAQISANRENDAQLRASISKKALEDKTEALRRFQEEKQGQNVVGGADAKFRGEVTKVSGDIVQFSGGLNSNVRVGGVYRITRPAAPYYIGTVTVTVSDPTVSAGNFTPASGKKAAGDYLPKAGDVVESK